MPSVSRRQFWPGLHGLRAVAAIAVLLHHAHALQGGGPVVASFGVTLFFVLSGFLIGGILIENSQIPGIGFTRYTLKFEKRRVFRIMPLFYLYLALAWWAAPRNESAWWFITYTSNFHNLPDAMRAGLGHTWTLCAEEQLYVLLPLIIWVTPAIRRRAMLMLLIGASIVFAGLASGDGLWTDAYNTTPALMGLFLLGTLVADIQRNEGLRIAPIWANLTWTLLGASLLGVLLDTGNRGVILNNLLLGGRVILGGLSALLVVIAIAQPPRWLCCKPLLHLGEISYGLYLWHPLLYLLIDRHTRDFAATQAGGVVVIVVKLLAVYVVATLSWYCFERPILRLRDRRRKAAPVAAVQAEPVEAVGVR